MKKRDIFDRLNAEFDSLTPAASDDLINAPIIANASDNTKMSGLQKNKKRSPFTFRRITAAVAALAVTAGIAATAIVFMPKTVTPFGYIQNDTFISLSINPALSVIADSDGKVVELTTKNRDAEILVAGTDKTALIGKDYGYVVKFLTEEAVSLGYFAASAGMNVAAVSCGGEEKTAQIVEGLRSETESVLASKGVTVPVTVTALGRGGVLTEAERIDPGLKGDEDLPELLAVLARDSDYIKKFGGEIGELFGEDADESVKTLYQMELLDDYIDLLDDRFEFLTELQEFNLELAGEDAVTEAFATDAGAFAAPDGWWLSWYARSADDDEDITELAEEFAELFEDYDEYGLTGLEPLLADGKPNTAASAKLNGYLEVYGAVDFEEMEDYVDELDDLLDDLNESNYQRIYGLFDDLLARLNALGADWAEFSASRGEVGGVDDYLQKTADSFRAIYASLKAAAAVQA